MPRSGSIPIRKRENAATGAIPDWELGFLIRLRNNIISEERNPINLTATATLLHGDVTDMMHKYISDGSVDLAIADVPYFLRGPQEPTVTDFYIQQNGMKPLFNEAWDQFESIEEYEVILHRMDR